MAFEQQNLRIWTVRRSGMAAQGPSAMVHVVIVVMERPRGLATEGTDGFRWHRRRLQSNGRSGHRNGVKAKAGQSGQE